MEKQAATISQELLFDPKNLTAETIKKYLCKDATDQELMMGLQIAKTFNLNPLKREVYFVKYNEKTPMQVLTGYEVYLKRAERSGKYDGLEIRSEGSVETGDLKAIVKVFRNDWKNPLTHEAFYSEYVQMKPIYKNQIKVGEEPNAFWKNKPITMIKKVAVSQAFRMAFPDEFDGMPYTSDEVVDQDHVIDVKLESVPDEKKPIEKDLKHNQDEDLITSEQGSSLLILIGAKGWTKQDLKEFSVFELGLNGITEIKNKHLLKIKDYFSKQKPINNSTKDTLDVLPEEAG